MIIYKGTTLDQFTDRYFLLYKTMFMFKPKIFEELITFTLISQSAESLSQFSEDKWFCKAFILGWQHSLSKDIEWSLSNNKLYRSEKKKKYHFFYQFIN